MGDVICPVQAPCGAMPCRRNVSVNSATLVTRVEAPAVEPVDFAHSLRCSPSPVKLPADDPMLAEVLLCTPQKDVSARTCATAAHSINVCPRGGRASLSHQRGFMGAALDSQIELLSGHNAFVADGPGDGPDFLFGARDYGADLESIFRGPAEVDLCLSRLDECNLGHSSPLCHNTPPSLAHDSQDVPDDE